MFMVEGRKMQVKEKKKHCFMLVSDGKKQQYFCARSSIEHFNT